VWWTLVRPALTPLLPAGLCRAAEAPPPGRRTDLYPLAIVAAHLGAATHIFWDGFTHWNGWGVALFPVLLEPAPGIGMQWCYVAQYVSSMVGLIVIAVWIVLALRRYLPEARRFAPGEIARLVRVGLFVSGVSLTVAAANAALAVTFIDGLGRAAIGFEIGLALGLVAYALYARR
jgi:hypothetical protein